MTTQKYFTCKEAAEYLRLAESTLEKLRLYGDGPAFIRTGGRIHYSVLDLDEWMNARRCSSTSDYTGAAS